MTLYDFRSLYFLDQVCSASTADNGGPYVVHNHVKQRYFQHPKQLLQDACIRYYGPATTPVPSVDAGVQIYSSAFTSQMDFKEDQLGQKQCSRDSECIQDPEIRAAIASMFQQGMVQFDTAPSPYRGVQVKKVLRQHGEEGKVRFFTLFVTGSGSTYCMNKLGEHNTNSVYFVISSRGIRQRCFCRCDVRRRYGTCKTYASGLCILPSSVRTLLFPSDRRMTSCATTTTMSDKKRKQLNRLLRAELALMQSRSVQEVRHIKKRRRS